MSLIQERDIEYAAVGDQSLCLDTLRPSESSASLRPAVIYVHGGGWHMGDRGDSPNYLLAEQGMATCSIDYRLTGAAPFPAQIHDVKAAIRWVRAHAGDLGIDPDRIGIWGHSAGGHLALLAAMTGDDPALEGNVGDTSVSSAVRSVIAGCTRTEMLVDWYAAESKSYPEAVSASLDALFGGVRLDRQDLVRAASPFWHLRAGLPPALLMHGTSDETVPINQARAFVARSRAFGNDGRLMELPGLGHDIEPPLFPGNADACGSSSAVTSFFARTLMG